jgi:uncharacterized protein (DUF433 family)
MKVQDEEQLISRFVDLDTERYPGGRADARLKDSGVAIWAIVAFLHVYDNDVARVADHFTISVDEVEAALAYYRRNRKYVDARAALNEA